MPIRFVHTEEDWTVIDSENTSTSTSPLMLGVTADVPFDQVSLNAAAHTPLQQDRLNPTWSVEHLEARSLPCARDCRIVAVAHVCLDASLAVSFIQHA